MSELVRVFWTTGTKDQELGLIAGEIVRIGRGTECEVQLAHLPEPDRSIPRVAGEIQAQPKRVYFHSETVADRHPPLGLRRGDTGAFADVAHGEGWSPDPGRNGFEIQLRGIVHSYTIQVECSYIPRISDAPKTAIPTKRREVDLTARQLEAVKLYAAEDLIEPPSHAEVAAAMGIESRTAIKHITDARDAFLRAGLPMQEYQQIARSVAETYRHNKHLINVSNP